MQSVKATFSELLKTNNLPFFHSPTVAAFCFLQVSFHRTPPVLQHKHSCTKACSIAILIAFLSVNRKGSPCTLAQRHHITFSNTHWDVFSSQTFPKAEYSILAPGTREPSAIGAQERRGARWGLRSREASAHSRGQGSTAICSPLLKPAGKPLGCFALRAERRSAVA